MSDYAMTSLLTRKHLPLLVILSFLWVRPAFSATEFNTDVLDIGERSKVDLSRFSDADYVMPGAYLLDIKINQKTLPQRSIQYFPSPDNKAAARCACRLTWWKNGAERRSGQKSPCGTTTSAPTFAASKARPSPIASAAACWRSPSRRRG